jgi:hypothetical protein
MDIVLASDGFQLFDCCIGFLLAACAQNDFGIVFKQSLPSAGTRGGYLACFPADSSVSSGYTGNLYNEPR